MSAAVYVEYVRDDDSWDVKCDDCGLNRNAFASYLAERWADEHRTTCPARTP